MLSRILLIFALLIPCAATTAQDPPWVTVAGKEHAWLRHFAGEWAAEMHAPTAEGQPPMEGKGTWKAEMLGDHWIVCQMDSDMMGTSMRGMLTVGFDAEKQRYIGTWIDSSGGYMWRYVGDVDGDKKALTLEAEAPSFLGGAKSTKYHDVYRFTSKDEFSLESRILGEDGQWVTYLTGTFRRKK